MLQLTSHQSWGWSSLGLRRESCACLLFLPRRVPGRMHVPRLQTCCLPGEKKTVPCLLDIPRPMGNLVPASLCLARQSLVRMHV